LQEFTSYLETHDIRRVYCLPYPSGMRSTFWESAAGASYSELRKPWLRDTRQCGWDNEDESILPYMMIASGIALLGWLNSRSDNPSLRKNFKIVTTRVVKQLKAHD
jgi:hypothetical protein